RQIRTVEREPHGRTNRGLSRAGRRSLAVARGLALVLRGADQEVTIDRLLRSSVDHLRHRHESKQSVVRLCPQGQAPGNEWQGPGGTSAWQVGGRNLSTPSRPTCSGGGGTRSGSSTVWMTPGGTKTTAPFGLTRAGGSSRFGSSTARTMPGGRKVPP